jgi:hypothetical protein
VSLTFSDTASDWLDWDKASTTISTKSDLSKQSLGTFGVTVEMSDTAGNVANSPIVIELACVAGNSSPLCAPPEPEPSTVAAVATTAAADTASTAASAIEDFTLDYEVKKTVPIEELVAPLDTSLEEDDDFEDVPGVLSSEQAAGIIEEISSLNEIAAEDVKFDETLIPTGSIPPPPEEELATYSEEQLAELEQ